MNTPQSSNFIFGIEGRDLSLGAELDALSAKVQAFGRDSTAAFTQFSTGLSAVDNASTKASSAIGDVGDRTERAGKQAQTSAGFFGSLKDKILAIGEGLIIYKAFETVESAVSDLTKSIIALPAAYEQSEIGFKAMLGGDAQAADQMLQKLQQLANVTPFKFAEEQSAARTLLGLGQAADKVLPELVDIDTAVAAVGGNEEQVQKVAAALGKMTAEGRVSAIFMNELTRDGIPAWVMLSEEMGVSVAKVRELSQNGEIAASTFEKAFHDYTIRHWGDALSEQSQTFQGLISTAQDLAEQFVRTFGMPIIQELEPRLRGAVQALQDPRVLATITQWGQAAAEFAGHILDAATWVAQMLGLPLPKMSTDIQTASEAVQQFAGDWSSADTSVADTQTQIKGMQDQVAKLRDAEAEVQLSYEHQIEPLQRRVTLLDRAYERENALANLAVTQEKVARDRALAVDIYSSQGREAAARLPEEEARLAEQQRGIQHTAQKAALDDQVYALQQQEKAQKESYDRQERLLEASIRALQAKSSGATTGGTGRTGGTTKPTRTAADAEADYLKSLDQQQRDAIRVAQAIKDGQGLTGLLPPASGLFEKLFGTSDQQLAAGTGLADQLVKGFGTAIHEWAIGHGSDAMKLLMGGDDLGDAVHKWVGEVGGVENLGAELAHAMFPDWPGLLPWLSEQINPAGAFKPDVVDRVKKAMQGDTTGGGYGPSYPGTSAGVPQSSTPGGSSKPYNIVGNAVGGAIATSSQQKLQGAPGGPPHMADPNRPGWVDMGPTPGNWQYNPAEWEALTGKAMPGVYNGPYSAGGAVPGHRALGGPASAGQLYNVNEPWSMGNGEYFIPNTNGQIVPGGSGGGDLGTITLRFTDQYDREWFRTQVTVNRDYVMRQVALSARNNR